MVIYFSKGGIIADIQSGVRFNYTIQSLIFMLHKVRAKSRLEPFSQWHVVVFPLREFKGKRLVSVSAEQHHFLPGYLIL
jgi:hypothetical protein